MKNEPEVKNISDNRKLCICQRLFSKSNTSHRSTLQQSHEKLKSTHLLFGEN